MLIREYTQYNFSLEIVDACFRAFMVFVSLLYQLLKRCVMIHSMIMNLSISPYHPLTFCFLYLQFTLLVITITLFDYVKFNNTLSS